MRLKFGTKIKKGLIIAASFTLLLVYTVANSAAGPIITEAGVDPKITPSPTSSPAPSATPALAAPAQCHAFFDL